MDKVTMEVAEAGKGVARVITMAKEIFAVTKRHSIAVDIGGSVIKVVISRPFNESHNQLCLQNFSMCHMDQFFDFVKRQNTFSECYRILYTTGVGCLVYKRRLEKQLNVRIVNLEEMTCMTRALRLLLASTAESELIYPQSSSVQHDIDVYTSQMIEMKRSRIQVLESNGQETDYIYPQFKSETMSESDDETPYPYLLVMLGSGCLVMQVEASGYKVIDSSPSSGRAFMALANLLTSCTDFHQLTRLASRGDNRLVDMTGAVMKSNVPTDCDMYGCIADDMLMYSFGQATTNDRDSFRREDILRSLVVKTCADLAQVIGLNHHVSKAKHVYLVGSLVDESQLIRDEITKRIGLRNLLSTANGHEPTTVKFVRHGGYLGALGALLMSSTNKTVSSKL